MKKILDTGLSDQAFELVFARSNVVSDVRSSVASKGELRELELEIELFIAQSPEHELAMARADAEWALLGRAELPPLSGGQKIQLSLQRHLSSAKDKPKKLLPLAAALLIILMMPMLGSNIPSMESQGVEPRLASGKPYATAYGERSDVDLADGSVLCLNWQTQIAVSMTPNRREISLLAGEVTFTVAKDTDRPFVVSAGDLRIRAVGTEFSVKHLGARKAKVVVSEGVVELWLRKSAKKVRLVAGQTVSLHGGEIGVIKTHDKHNFALWRDGVLVFKQRPLGEVIDELNRYTRYEIKVDAALDITQKVTATYFTGQIDEALSSLVQLFHLTPETRIEGNKTILVLREALLTSPLGHSRGPIENI